MMPMGDDAAVPVMKRLGHSMRAVLAERYGTDSLCDDLACGFADDAGPSSDRMSSRGLEILRILNDVFNGLPMQTASMETAAAGHTGEN
jgi:hypothetical protein